MPRHLEELTEFFEVPYNNRYTFLYYLRCKGAWGLIGACLSKAEILIEPLFERHQISFRRLKSGLNIFEVNGRFGLEYSGRWLIKPEWTDLAVVPGTEDSFYGSFVSGIPESFEARRLLRAGSDGITPMVDLLENSPVHFDRLAGCWATTFYRVTVGFVCGLWGEAFSHNGWIVEPVHQEIDTEDLYSEGDHVHWEDVWLKVKVDGKYGYSEKLNLVGCFE